MSVFSFLKPKRNVKTPSCSAVIAAAGESTRMDGQDKLFIEILNAPILAHTLKLFESCDLINEIIIVTREGSFERVIELCAKHGISKAKKVVIGGPTRLISVYNGVFAISADAELVAIHDGARPCATIELIKRTIESANKNHAATPAVAVSSTIKRAVRGAVTETLDRVELFEIQTPQVFDADLIKAALTNACDKFPDITDDCSAVELIGATVYITEGSRDNIKLTTVNDVPIAEAILTKRV